MSCQICIAPGSFAIMKHKHKNLYVTLKRSQCKVMAKRYSQLKPSYKIKICIGGWPNDTAKSSQLARKPFNCLHTTAYSHKNNKTTSRVQTVENMARVGRTFDWLDPTRANSSQVGGQTIPNSIEVVNLARVGLSWEDRLARAWAANVLVCRFTSRIAIVHLELMSRKPGDAQCPVGRQGYLANKL